MDLEKAYPSQLETLRLLFKANEKDLITEEQKGIGGCP